MKHSTKRNVTAALLATAVTPWAYPFITVARQDYSNVSSEVPDISFVLASRERGRPDPIGPEASAVLNTSRMLQQIRNSTHDERSQVATTVESAVDTASRTVTALQDHRNDLADSTREQFQAAMRKTLAMEAQVRSGLQALRASTADTHADVRDKLAGDYESYSSAIAELESINRNAVGVS